MDLLTIHGTVEELKLKEVTNKIRSAPDFNYIYENRMGALVRDAYPPGAARNAALKKLNEYWKFSKELREAFPNLALKNKAMQIIFINFKFFCK